MKAKKPTRKQKKLLYEIFRMEPSDWLVVRWLPEDDCIQLQNRYTGHVIRRMKPMEV
ncbi:MAG: hypothetical protein UDB15_07250 [Ruminococcus sp.]|nr:hypothetical protein [Ruminococcus sp.]DAU60456.1 MAG TPA: hypothetical protein [Caudoviricetes sp.]